MEQGETGCDAGRGVQCLADIHGSFYWTKHLSMETVQWNSLFIFAKCRWIHAKLTEWTSFGLSDSPNSRGSLFCSMPKTGMPRPRSHP